MGERAGNIANVITLPRFNTFNLAAGTRGRAALSFGLNVKQRSSTARRDDLRGWA